MRLLRGLLALSFFTMPVWARAQNVLFYSGENGREFSTMVATAAANGWTLTHWQPGDGAMTASQLSAYDALVVGWSGDTQDFSGLLDSRTSLAAARGSRTFLTGQDPDYHQAYGNKELKAQRFISNAVNWAAGGSGLGVVVLSDYSGAWLTDPNSFLFPELTGSASYYNFGENVAVPGSAAGHAVNAGLTSTDLSDWSLSYLMTFATMTPGYTTVALSGDLYDPDTNPWGVDPNFASVTIVKDTNAGVIATPEPASTLLVATGLIGLVAAALRKRSA